MAVETIFQRADLSAPALINPTDTTEKIKDFPKICVSTFSDNIIRKFASMEHVEQIAELYTANGAMPVYKIRYKNTEIAFFQSRVGAPACVVGFEEVVAMGAEQFVLFGSCGVLDDEKVKGKIIIPVSAVRDEGTSYHYVAPSPEIEADERCVNVLERVLQDLEYPYVKGKTWTSDGIYRESMLAVSQYRKVPFIQFLYGADNLGDSTWEIRDLMQYGLDGAEKYMALAFECGIAMKKNLNTQSVL